MARTTLFAAPWSAVYDDGKNGAIVGLEKATLKTLSAGEAAELWSDITRVVNAHKEPMVSDMIRRSSGYIRALVEAVNDNSKQGYGGMAADGSELAVQWFTPEDFVYYDDNGDETAFNMSGWQRWLSAPRITTFTGGTTLEEEGLIILGFANGVASPAVDALKIFKGTEESTVEPLAWIRHIVCCKSHDPTKATVMSGCGFNGCTDWQQNCFYGGGSQYMPVYELRKPIVIPPETTWRVDEKRLFSGCDALQPIGFRVRTAMAAWNLTF